MPIAPPLAAEVRRLESCHPRRRDVTELLADFTVTESRTLLELSREVRTMVGVATTPGPPEGMASLSPRVGPVKPAR
jgi:hypothetical protein